jgi:hypothetical protein
MLFVRAIWAPFLTCPATSEARLISANLMPELMAFSLRCSKQGMQFAAVAAQLQLESQFYPREPVLPF